MALDLTSGKHVGRDIVIGMSSAAVFQIGDLVRLAFEPFDESPTGVVTGIYVSPAELLYMVTWSDSRQQTRHHELELIIVD